MPRSKSTPTGGVWTFISEKGSSSNVRSGRRRQRTGSRRSRASCVSGAPCSKGRLPTRSKKAGSRTNGSIWRGLSTGRESRSMPTCVPTTNAANTTSPASDRRRRKSMKSNPTTPPARRWRSIRRARPTRRPSTWASRCNGDRPPPPTRSSSAGSRTRTDPE